MKSVKIGPTVLRSANFMLRALPSSLQEKTIKFLLMQFFKLLPKTTIKNHEITSAFLIRGATTSRLLAEGGHYTGRFVFVSKPCTKTDLESMIDEEVDEKTCESKFRKWLDSKGFKELDGLIDRGIESED